MIRKAQSGVPVNFRRLQAAAELLLGHHGARGTAIAVLEQMAGDGFKIVGRRIAQNEW